MPKVVERDWLPVGTSELASYDWLGTFCPAISKIKVNGLDRYQVRIIVGRSWRGATSNVSYDYFELDATGLIISSPRGRGKEFNQKVRILNMDKHVEWAKDKYFNQ